MNINIERNLKEQTEINMLKRKLALRSANFKITLFILTTIVLLLTKLFYPDRESVSGNTPLAMIFLGFAIMLYYESHFNDGLLPKKLKSFSTKNFVKIEINDLDIIVDVPDIYLRRSWHMIKKYKFYKNFIFLFNEKTMYQNATVIDKAELSKDEFDELYAFLIKNKIEKGKIK